MDLEETKLTINHGHGTFALAIEGSSEPTQALDLVRHVLAYAAPVEAAQVEAAPAPPVLWLCVMLAAREYADAHREHTAKRSGATGKALIKANAALLAAVEAGR